MNDSGLCYNNEYIEVEVDDEEVFIIYIGKNIHEESLKHLSIGDYIGIKGFLFFNEKIRISNWN